MPSVQDVRDSFSGERRERELRTNLLGFVTYRQLSFYATPLFLAASIHPTVITLATIPLCLAMPAAAWAGGPHAYLWVAALSLVYHLFDYVDGNVARMTGKTSQLGRYLDSLIGGVYWLSVYAALGLLADREAGGLGVPGAGVLIALAMAWMDIFGKESRLYAKLNFGEKTPTFGQTQRHTPLTAVSVLIVGLASLMPLWLVLLGPFGLLRPLLIVATAHRVLLFLYVQWRIIRTLSA